MAETEFEFFVNGKRFAVPTSQILGVQVRAIAALDPQVSMVIEGIGNEPDHVLEDDTKISLEHRAVRVYTRPPTMMGAAPENCE